MKSLRWKCRQITALGLVLGLTVLTGCTANPVDSGTGDPAARDNESGSGAPLKYNTTTEQNRIRSTISPEAVELLPKEIAEKKVLRVGNNPDRPPLGFYADDNKTIIGSEIDIAQLLADSLGLELEIVSVTWEGWPLELQSTSLDVVVSNVGINPARLELFDFVTYREGFMSFVGRTDSTLSINGPEDAAGLTIDVNAGTNQETILQTWDEQNQAKGLEPIEIVSYKSSGDSELALQSGRIDLKLTANPTAVYQQEVAGKQKIVGTINAGWPNTTYVGTATAKGNGLAEAIEAAFQHVFEDGTFAQVLQRWGLEKEAVSEPQINPELPSASEK